MRVRPRYPWSIVLGLLLTALTPVIVITLAVLLASLTTRLPAGAAFRADGVVISDDALQQRIRVLGALYGLQPPADPARADAFRRAAANAVMLSTVLDKAARDDGIVVSEQQSRQLLQNFIEKNVHPPGQAGFIQLLRDAGASQPDVVDELSRQQATSELYHRVTDEAAAEVNEPAARAYFDQHHADMTVPEKRHLRNIVVDTEDEAQQLLTELRSGSDFGQLAAQSSVDDTGRSTGGDLGTLSADQLEPSYAHAAFSAAPGGYYGPVQTPQGWNVGQVEQVMPSVPLRFEQVGVPLLEQLRQQRADVAWSTWLSQRLARADVTFADRYRPVGGLDAAFQPPGGDTMHLTGGSR
jgi:peptidyl-prolyl cis-trans isomerase C